MIFRMRAFRVNTRLADSALILRKCIEIAAHTAKWLSQRAICEVNLKNVTIDISFVYVYETNIIIPVNLYKC